MSYNLKKDNEVKELLYFSYNVEGLTINTKSKKKHILKINKITISDPEYINNYINIKLDKKFKKLVKLVYEMLSTEDETDSDITNFLGEIDKLKSIIENKYKYYLNILEYDRFMKKLFLIEKELKERLIQIQMNNYYYNNNTELIEEEKKSR